MTSRLPVNDARVSHTAREIASQPAMWRRAARMTTAALPASGLRTCFVGCGTSLHMAQSMAALRESAGHGISDAFAASEVPGRREYDVVVGVSRSGETSELVRLFERPPGRRTVAITASPHSQLARVADATVDLGFADEQSVVQTRFATTALALWRTYVDNGSLGAAIADAEAVLTSALPVAPDTFTQWTFLGRGWAVGVANEAALKMREGAQAWAESYPTFEHRHGPIAIAGPGRIVWSFGALEQAAATAIRATGATLVAPAVDPMAGLILVQRTMVAAAAARRLDPDAPRNITRAVTLTAAELRALA